MCRNIKLLHHLAPPATEEEIRASALQYVRKLSGMQKPSERNRAAFERAVDEVARATHRLFERLEPGGPVRTREEQAARARERGKKREAAMLRKLVSGPAP